MLPPSGERSICSLDILSSAGLVNFIGKSIDLKEVSVSPVLLQKGETRLAVYGLSHIADKRLYRMMEEDKVRYFLACLYIMLTLKQPLSCVFHFVFVFIRLNLNVPMNAQKIGLTF